MATDPSASIDGKQVAILSTQYVDDNSGAVIEKKTRAERVFVLRLDLILLFYCCVSQVMKGLDQQSRSCGSLSGLSFADDARCFGCLCLRVEGRYVCIHRPF